MCAHRIHIPLLAERFCLDRFALCGDADHIAPDFRDLILPPVAHQAEHILYRLCADALAALCQLHQRLNGLHRKLHVARIRTRHLELGLPAEDGHIQLLLQYLHIFIERAENTHNQVDRFDAHGHFCHISFRSPCY